MICRVVLTMLVLGSTAAHAGRPRVDLSGSWRFQLDGDKLGVEDAWYGGLPNPMSAQDLHDIPSGQKPRRGDVRSEERIGNRDHVGGKPWNLRQDARHRGDEGPGQYPGDQGDSHVGRHTLRESMLCFPKPIQKHPSHPDTVLDLWELRIVLI